MALDDVALGLCGIINAEGSLDRPVGEGSWLVPESMSLAKEGDVLLWGRGGGDHRTRADRTIRSGPGMLDAFVRLADAEPERVLAFARDWGVLGLCGQHLRPMTHIPARVWSQLEDDYHPCRPAGGVGRPYFEPLDRWREYARQAETMLTITSTLSSGTTTAPPLPDSVWEPLAELLPFPIEPVLASNDIDLAGRRRLVARAVDEWLRLGGVEIQFDWTERRPQIHLGGGSLFGGLALQLALAVGRVDGLAVCDECGRPFVPKRRNKSGPRRCEARECRKLAPQRRYAREKRAGFAVEDRP